MLVDNYPEIRMQSGIRDFYFNPQACGFLGITLLKLRRIKFLVRENIILYAEVHRQGGIGS